MRGYTAQAYEKLVEDINDKTLQAFMADEALFLDGIEDGKTKTFVDLGAGYGRALPVIAKIAHDVIAIEINPEMYGELERRAKEYTNVNAVQGDFLKLANLLPTDIQNPIFLILQNSLGTIEGGDYKDVVDVVVGEAVKHNGQLVLSLLRQPALRDWGISMYGKLREMVGEVDMEKSDFTAGLLVTNTGYVSKWWTDEDIDGLKALGKVEQELIKPEYCIIRLSVQ